MKNIKQITVFLASPNDVDDERQIVEETISELNQTWGKPNGYHIKLENWEKSSYPGLGDDAQDVLSKQLDFDFDIFVCIFWKRIGTPTKRAESGTIEELENALKKHKSGENIEIMGYFNDEAIPPSEFNEQVMQVNNLREKFKKLGLYQSFKGSEKFSKIFRVTITNCLNNRYVKGNNEGKIVTVESDESNNKLEIINRISDIAIDKNYEELGVLESYEIIDIKSERLTFILQDLSNTIELMSQNLDKRTSEIDKINFISDNRLKMKMSRRVINHSADNMDVLSRKLELEFDNFKTIFSDLINSITVVYGELNYLENEKETKSLIGLTEAIESSINGMGEMFLSINDLPRMTSKIGIAKSKLLKNLKSYIDELEFGYELLVKLQNSK